MAIVRRQVPPRPAVREKPASPWPGRVALASAVVALGSGFFALYKGLAYDRRLAAIEVAQKDIDLSVAKDAILAYGFGEPLVTTIQATATGTLDGLKPQKGPRVKMMTVTVPVTIKNLSRLPIAIDFNEQWAFLGRMLGSTAAGRAEVLNASNDAYPIAWRRSQCVVGVASDAWNNVGLGTLVVSQAKAGRLRDLGPAFWTTPDLLTGSQDALRTAAGMSLVTPEAKAQYQHLRAIMAKPAYHAATDVGAGCTLLNGGVFVATLRAGEEKSLKATYVVRGDEQWFSHILRLHYRQVHPGSQEQLPEYRFQDLRQTVFLQPTAAAKEAPHQ